MRLGVFLLAVALGAAGACSNDTFSGDDGGGDTGTDVGPIGGGDGSADATKIDGAVDAGPKRFCETQDAQFCADFDIPGDAGAGFPPPDELGEWRIDFQSARAKSTPMAVEYDTSGDAGGATLLLPGLSPDGSVKSQLVVEADVFLPSPLPATPDPIFVLSAGVYPKSPFVFGLCEQSGAWALARFGTFSSKPLSPTPATDEWAHARLVIQLSSNSGTVTLEIDSSNGTSLASMSGFTEPDGGAPGYPGTVTLGGNDPGTSIVSRTMFIDDVIANWQ